LFDYHFVCKRDKFRRDHVFDDIFKFKMSSNQEKLNKNRLYLRHRVSYYQGK